MNNPFILALLAAMFYGSAPIFEKLGLQKADPIAGIFYRSISVALIVLVYSLITGNLTRLFSYEIKPVLFLITGGILSAFVAQFFYFSALKAGNASRVVPIAASFPLVTTFIAVVVLGESISLIRIAGIFLILGGIYLLK